MMPTWNVCCVDINTGEIRTFNYAPFDALVLEPCDGYCNCPYTKEDMIQRKVPCIIVVPADVVNGSWYDDFQYWVGADGVGKVYFGDDEESVLKFAHLYPMTIGGY